MESQSLLQNKFNIVFRFIKFVLISFMKQHLKFKLFQLIGFILLFVFSSIAVFAQRSCCKENNGRSNRGLDVASDSGADFGPNNSQSVNYPETQEKPKNYPEGFKPLQITSKPRATHTESSRRNCIEGKVLLRLTFFSDGTVGNIKVIKGLPAGLNKKAIEAAKKIKFEPQVEKGKLNSVRKSIEYGFWLY